MALLLGWHYEFPQCWIIKGKLLIIIILSRWKLNNPREVRGSNLRQDRRSWGDSMNFPSVRFVRGRFCFKILHSFIHSCLREMKIMIVINFGLNLTVIKVLTSSINWKAPIRAQNYYNLYPDWEPKLCEKSHPKRQITCTNFYCSVHLLLFYVVGHTKIFLVQNKDINLITDICLALSLPRW
jgi:hypothetical protein